MLDVPTLLKEHAARLEPILSDLVPRRADDFLSDGVWYQFESGGKRLRPALCLMTCEVLGGDPSKAIRFALATEILHNFLLAHDDIEDGDTFRRDRPTLWAKFGVPNAINVADYLIAKAYRLIFESPVDEGSILALGRAFTFAFERTVEGQALDINLRGREDVDLAMYYRIVTHKTAYYLALPWVGGALVAGVPEESLGPFWELGECLGPAFQIRDDVIDLTVGKGRGGEVGCDIREGKPSVLVAWVFEKRVGSDEARRRLLSIIQAPREETTAGDIDWAIGFFREHGALDFAESEARRLIDRGEEVVARLPLSDDGRSAFREIARFIVDRRV